MNSCASVTSQSQPHSPQNCLRLCRLSSPQPPFSFDTPFLSIRLLHFYLDGSVPLGWWMCSQLTPWLVDHQISNSLSACARALSTRARKHTYENTHTLSSPVHTLSDAQSMNWRPSFHGKHPMRPHCMCDCVWETERGRDSERVHAFSLMRAVYYSCMQSVKHILNCWI